MSTEYTPHVSLCGATVSTTWRVASDTSPSPPQPPTGLEAPAPRWAGGGQGAAPAGGLRFPTVGGGWEVMLPGALGPALP